MPSYRIEELRSRLFAIGERDSSNSDAALEAKATIAALQAEFPLVKSYEASPKSLEELFVASKSDPKIQAKEKLAIAGLNLAAIGAACFAVTSLLWAPVAAVALIPPLLGTGAVGAVVTFISGAAGLCAGMFGGISGYFAIEDKKMAIENSAYERHTKLMANPAHKAEFGNLCDANARIHALHRELNIMRNDDRDHNNALGKMMDDLAVAEQHGLEHVTLNDSWLKNLSEAQTALSENITAQLRQQQRVTPAAITADTQIAIAELQRDTPPAAETHLRA